MCNSWRVCVRSSNCARRRAWRVFSECKLRALGLVRKREFNEHILGVLNIGLSNHSAAAAFPHQPRTTTEIGGTGRNRDSAAMLEYRRAARDIRRYMCSHCSQQFYDRRGPNSNHSTPMPSLHTRATLPEMISASRLGRGDDSRTTWTKESSRRSKSPQRGQRSPSFLCCGHQRCSNAAAQSLPPSPKAKRHRQHKTGKNNEKGSLHDVAADSRPGSRRSSPQKS